MSTESHQSILSEYNGIKIDERFVLKLIKGGKNVNKEVKNSCKVLQFSSDWSFEEVLATISDLKSEEYPQLFIFVVNGSNNEKNSSKFQKILIKFGSHRPIMLQILLNEDNLNLYLKYKHSDKFITVNNKPDNLKDKDDFVKFLNQFLDSQFDNFEDAVLKILPKHQNRQLILKFLLVLTSSEPFFGSMVLEITTNGSKAELLSALDVSFESNGRILSKKAQNYISDVFEDDDDTTDDNLILLTSVKHKSAEIIDYLITFCSHLIQQLPFDHQVSVSTSAFETNQLNVLCDLLNIAEFAFPCNFTTKQEKLVEHEKIGMLINERAELNAAIKAENFPRIDEFIDKNPRLKFIYNQYNISALTTAINSKSYSCFHYLRSLDFQGEHYEDVLKELGQDEKKKAVTQAIKQRKANVLNAKTNINKPVLLLSTRALIHNSRISKDQDAEYRNKIAEWFQVIYNVGPELINVAATCENLKIIFEFESDTVENVSLAGSNALGSTYTKNKWIFIGSKLMDRDREQQIKGVLAHELCHYVIHLVYENQEKPYYKHMIKDIEKFQHTVEITNKWSPNDTKYVDDECNGIISSVFIDYDCNYFHPELIVRVIQILVQFDEDKVSNLQTKYLELFGFWRTFVVPEIQKFCNEHRQEVRRINKNFELFDKIKNAKHEPSVHKIFKIIHGSQIVKKYLNQSEIFKMIKNKDKFKENLLIRAVHCNNKSIIEFTRNEIKSQMNELDLAIYLNECFNENINLKEISSKNEKHKYEVHDWVLKLAEDYQIDLEKKSFCLWFFLITAKVVFLIVIILNILSLLMYLANFEMNLTHCFIFNGMRVFLNLNN